jgi:hypothetical protein
MIEEQAKTVTSRSKGCFDPEDGGDVLPKRRALSELHGVRIQKTVMTAVRTANSIRPH